MNYIGVEDDPTKRLIQYPGIANEINWPKADSAKACIFEALRVIGKGLFGEEWDGSEFSAVLWLEQPIMEMARKKLAQRKPPPPVPESVLGSGYRRLSTLSSPSHDQHVHEYRSYTETMKRQQRWVRNDAARARLEAATNWLAEKCRDGMIKTFYRFTSGGELREMKPSEWNIELPLATLISNGGFKRWFPLQSGPKQWDVYIFVDWESLRHEVAALAHTATQLAQTDLSRLSPYLQLAVKLALAKDYTSGHKAETQPVREAEVKALWKDALPDIPVSGNAIQAIAKVIGFPDATAILQGQSARNGKKGRNP